MLICIKIYILYICQIHLKSFQILHLFYRLLKIHILCKTIIFNQLEEKFWAYHRIRFHYNIFLCNSRCARNKIYEKGPTLLDNQKLMGNWLGWRRILSTFPRRWCLWNQSNGNIRNCQIIEKLTMLNFYSCHHSVVKTVLT